MAIRNTNFTGATTNWASGELGLKSVDLNDTFDAAFNKIQTLSTFWLNSDLYEVYDDFESYSLGAFATNSKWTVSSGGTIVASTNAGGSSQELYINASGTVTRTVSTKELKNNRHTFFRCYINTNGVSNNNISGNAQIRFANTGSYYKIFNWGTSGIQQHTVISDVKVINTGDGDYDLYIGGKLVASYSGVSVVNAKILDIQVSATTGGTASTNAQTKFYMDDVRQSAFDVN